MKSMKNMKGKNSYKTCFHCELNEPMRYSHVAETRGRIPDNYLILFFMPFMLFMVQAFLFQACEVSA